MRYHSIEGCGDMLAGVQAGEEQLHASVQLFATGIKTTVKQAACSPFHSTDAYADDSALAVKVCDSAATPRTCCNAMSHKLGSIASGLCHVHVAFSENMPTLCRPLQQHGCTSEACAQKNSVVAVRPAWSFMWSVRHWHPRSGTVRDQGSRLNLEKSGGRFSR